MQNSQLLNSSVIRYSKALYGISVDKNIQNKMYEESKELLDVFSKNNDFENLFKSPLLNKKKQVEVVSELFSDRKDNKITVSKDLFGLIILAI